MIPSGFQLVLCLSLLGFAIGCGSTQRESNTVIPQSRSVSTETLPSDEQLSKWEVGLIDSNDLCLADAFGNKKAVLAKNVEDFVWSPDGKLLAYSSDRKVMLRNMATGKVSQLINAWNQPKLTEVVPEEDWSFRPLCFDLDKQVLVVTDENDLYIVSLSPHPDWNAYPFLTQWNMTENAAAWSPSGKYLAFTRNGDVWLAEKGGDDKMDDLWSSIVLDYYNNANRLVAVATFNDVPRGVSVATPYWADGLSWTSDEKRLVFQYQRYGGSGVSEVGYIDLEPSTERAWGTYDGLKAKVTWIDCEYLVLDPQVCPDGKTLSGRIDIAEGWTWALMSWDGKQTRKLFGDAEKVRWRPAP